MIENEPKQWPGVYIMNQAVIYIRTSTTKQEEKNQLPDCQAYCKDKGWEVIGIYQEQLSGYKDIDRPERNKILEQCKQGKINHVVVWAFDRWIRNRDTLLADVTILSNHGVKLHSVKEAWLEAINLEGALGRTLKDFLLGLVGSLAEMESSRKSERVKLAVVREEGRPTQSYKGNRWGRPNISSQTISNVIALYEQGMSLRQIAKDVTYYDKNNNKRNISIGAVHKIVTKFNREKD